MYYAIEIGFLYFFRALSGGFLVCFLPLFSVLDVDLSSLFIVGEPRHRVYLDPDSNSKR
jgi:hypothetical protein